MSAAGTGSIVLAQPEWLWLLPLFLLITLLLRTLGARTEPSALATNSPPTGPGFRHPLIALLPPSFTAGRAPSHRALVSGLVFTCLVIALAEPVRIGERLPDPPQERDIVFIVDTSVSMTLRDYLLDGERIDRMSLLKGVLDRFVQRLPGERMAIIVFGDAAYTLVPLTRDQDLLRRMLARTQATMAGRFNAIGEAIALAVKQAGERPERHRVLVLLTDADQPTGDIDPLAAAGLAREAGLPLYTVAIGAADAAAEEGRRSGLLYQPVDLALLTAIAEHTGARNYQAGDAQALEQAIRDIAQHETNPRDVPPRHYRQSLYLWPLLLGLAVLVLAQGFRRPFFLPPRRETP